MPSSGFVEVDITNNNTAILDSSASDVVIASAPPSEVHNAISPIPPKSALAGVTQSQESDASPMPPKKLSMERQTKKPRAKKTVSSKDKSPSAVKIAKKDQDNTNVVTPRSKNATAVALTPTKPAIATPENSEKKEVKKKPPGLTLDSFFGKGMKTAVVKIDATKKKETVAAKQVIAELDKRVEGVSEVKTSTSHPEPKARSSTAATNVSKRSNACTVAPSFLDMTEDSPARAVAMAIAQKFAGRRRGKRSALGKAAQGVGEVGSGMSEHDKIESSGAEKEMSSDDVEVSVAVVEDMVGDRIHEGNKNGEADSIAQAATDIAQTADNTVDAATNGVDRGEERHDMDDDKTVELNAEKMKAADVPNSNSENSDEDAMEEQAPVEEVVFNAAVQVESPIKSSDDDESSSPKDAIAVEDATQQDKTPFITSSPKTAKTAKPKKKTTTTKSPHDEAPPTKGITSIGDSLKMFAARPKTSTQSTESTNKQELPIRAGPSQSPSDQVTSETSKINPAKNSRSNKTAATKTKRRESPKLKNTKDLPVTDGSILMADKSKPEADSKSASCKATAVKATELPTEPLSDENSARMKQYLTLRERYVIRAVEVASRSASDDFEEEQLCDTDLPLLQKGSVEIGDDGEFPDALVPRLLVLVQGSKLPLSIFSKNALETLSVFTNDARTLTSESISAKVKLIAQRKPYLSGNPPSPSEKPISLAKLDCFEDTNDCYLWRWELSSIDLLPQTEAAKVKKARATRKKLQAHHAAIIKLISSIDNATRWLVKNPTCSMQSSAVPVLAKVSDMEEKVLKFEREEEKIRLLNEVKAQKAKDKAEELAEKQKEKERLEEERLNAKRVKEEEKAKAAKEREEAKQKKETEKLKQQREAEEKELKRKARMMTFFSIGNTKKKQKTKDLSSSKASTNSVNPSSFDSRAFRSMINSEDGHVTNPFARLSQGARSSRKRKTKDVKVSVYVTVLSDNPFAPQPYDEEKIISVPNKYKFLGFHEDDRPPYHGTWSKRSSVVTGRRPFARDSEFLNYDVDSEAEWEQEDEDGEDCDKSEGEEEDVPNDDDTDSWLAAEDELGIDDEDEETRKLRKKKLLSEATLSVKACVIAPTAGGICHEMTEDAMKFAVEGFNPQDAMDLLSSHVGLVLTPNVDVCLDAIPPTDREEQEPKANTSQKMSLEASKTIAQFIHNSTVNSKEKIITELLNAHPTVTSSRAQAMRELEVTAEKRRLPRGAGVVWEVKADHLHSLGLTAKDLKSPPPLPDETTPPTVKTAVSIAVADPVPTSPVPPPNQPKQSKKRTKPEVSTASAHLFAAFIKKGNKKQKTD
ncbi:hypothetical protein HJC23_009786 [Cyclotella cryptica]|uniref:Chromatin assembly factor 1 subunit A dimerization domain-containing protein n=1 Tax=Cyclotella cryptica TaxID=29204 RepID=A0ABD3PTS5_9STRA|eukprot:CCRYP_012168-RA/>CCRYP_012168-RA protein AED:0.01 eAED:0.01 QI:186/1/1/1/1/1/3/409/1322